MERVMVENSCYSPPIKSEYWLIDSFDALGEYLTYLSKINDRATLRVLKSGVPVDDLGHVMGTFGDEKWTLGYAYFEYKHKGVSILEGITNAVRAKINGITNQLLSGTSVILNDAGGYCPLTGPMVLIERMYSKKPGFEDSVFIKKGTSVLVLENDPSLPKESKEYLRSIDNNYSSILDLRLLSNEQIEDALRQFKKEGGELIWVYTTGMDVEQMYNYSNLAKAQGITKFRFHFTAKVTPKIDEFISNISTSGFQVEILKNLETQVSQ